VVTENPDQDDLPGWANWLLENQKAVVGVIVYTIVLLAGSLLAGYYMFGSPDKKGSKIAAQQSDSADLFFGQGDTAEIVVEFDSFVVKMTLDRRNKVSGVYKGSNFRGYLPSEGEAIFTDENMIKARKANRFQSYSPDNQPEEKVVTPKATGYEDISEVERKEFFKNKLRRKYHHVDNKKLQRVLNQLGFKVATQGHGSPGKETEEFGPGTEEALALFKEEYQEQIEHFGDFDPSGAVFDKATMDFMNYHLTINEEHQVALNN